MGFPLNEIIVIHTTSKRSGAQTDARFRLNLRKPTGAGFLSLDFPTHPHNERERGRTDEYRFDVRALGFNDMDFLKKDKRISMTTLGGDAWLPSSLYVIGVPNSGAPELLKTHHFWQHLEDPDADGWFSTQESDGDGKARATWFLDFIVPL
jgi:hypothetical protein